MKFKQNHHRHHSDLLCCLQTQYFRNPISLISKKSGKITNVLTFVANWVPFCVADRAQKIVQTKYQT